MKNKIEKTSLESLDYAAVNTLYTLSEKSLATATLFALFFTYALYSQLGTNILPWGIAVTLLSLSRLYFAYLFKKNYEKYSLKTWYKIFYFLALITALCVSSLGFWYLHDLDDYYQLFVLSGLLALAAGATISLSSDYKIATPYISIIIIPLIVSLAMQNTALNVIIPVLLVLFFFSQMTMIFKSYDQDQKIKDLLAINQELLDENKDFIADMVHQIKTPLTTIMLNTSLIEMKSDEKTSPNVRQINSAISMLNNAYEDLSYIISNDTIDYKAKNINISQFLHTRIDFFQDIIQDNNKKITIHIENEIFVMMNDTELERIIDNNIANAIKHSNENSTIEIHLMKKYGKAILEFISEGKTIKDVTKIFEKNYTENHTAKRSLGLGLNMVKNICLKNSVNFAANSLNGTNTFTYIFKI